MSLLTIISDPEEGAAVLCGLPSPSAVVGTTDPNVPTLLRLANQEGRELARRHDWQALMVDYTVASLGAELQTALPTDFERLLPNIEIWNRTLGLKYDGPTDPRKWGQIKGLGLTTGQPGWWRLLGNALYITPAPTAGQTLAFPYISKNWAASSGGTPQAKFAADGDVARIPERLITLGIIWRYKSSKGFDYAEAMSTYEREVERACSRDRGTAPVILSKPRRDDGLVDATWHGVIVP
jgi:hypothetical protein